MSILSYFIFSKIKNHLKKNNVELKEFIFFDKNKLLLNIDNKELYLTGDLRDNVLKEIDKQGFRDVSEILVTKSKIILKSKTGTLEL